MQFLYWPLTWGFLLVGVPILVHLINLLRHRRQKWAAMDFLLESYRRNRRWVMLKQWLLLLARMLAMALLVVMLAKWVTSAQWLSWLGGRTTHHYILLDDSASMGAMQPGNESAYDRALRAVNGLVRDIASQPGDHQMTLIRWSRAGLAMRNFEDTSAPGQPDSSAQNTVDLASDLFAQSVPRDPSRLLDRLTATAPTALRLSPETAIESILPSLVNQSSEVPILYLLSDLRRNEFSEVEGLRRQLKQLSDAEVAIHLIDCAEQEDPNLTLASLSPQQEVWAAGVPVLVRFSVRNSSSLPARNVVAKVRTVDYPEGEVSPTADQEFSGKANELPPVVIESIEPGQTVTRQFQVVFSAPGQHIVEVTLPEDSLTSDNQRWAVIDIRNSQRVLLVDGDVNQLNAFYFESALQPGERLRTGLTFQKVDPSYLRDVSEEELATYDSVALLDVPRLDPQAVDRLMDYCAAGGGVLMVMGGNTNLAFANEQLYRGAQGLLPVELERIEESPDALLSPKPDTATSQVTATEHPILAPLRNLATNPFFALRIRKQLLPAQRSLEQPGLSIVATGPNQSPLIVDRAIESGRVVAMLTGLSSDWSTWAQDPTFVVFVLRSLGYLGSFRRDPWEAPAGTDLEMTVSDASVLPDGDILFPARNGQRMRMQRPIEFSDSNNVARLRLPVSLLDGLDRSVFDGLLRSGVYESWMMTGDGGYFLQNFAHNVAPEEGQLDRVAHQELQRQFPGVDLQVRSSSSLLGGIGSREATQSNIAMVLLIGLLIVEQVLAYSASYHAQANPGRSQAPPQHVGASR